MAKRIFVPYFKKGNDIEAGADIVASDIQQVRDYFSDDPTLVDIEDFGELEGRISDEMEEI